MHKENNMEKIYDCVIVGGGPAGLTSAIYLARAGKKCLVLERETPGGQMVNTTLIENYPGFKSITGTDLSLAMKDQVESLGVKIVQSDVLSYDLHGEIKSLRTYMGLIQTKTVILALGASNRQLECQGERRYIGNGVSFCATCDGSLYANKTVAVVGGGNTAFTDVIYLSNICKKVYIIHRRDAFRADDILIKKVDELASANKVEYLLNTTIVDITGKEKVNAIDILNKLTGETKTLLIDGVFVAIGRTPDTALLQDLIELDSSGYIVTDSDMKTSLPGVFAAGDARVKKLRQIVTATSDGAIAALGVINYLN